MTMNLKALSNDSFVSPVTFKKKFDCSTRASLYWETLSCQRSLRRQDASVCVVEDDETPIGILMVGGTSSASLCLSNVEMYDTNRREWSLLPAMSSPRSGCCIASLENHVYVFGGVSDKNERLDTCESLSQDFQEWSSEPSMPTHRWFGAAVSLPRHGDILLLGGRDNQWKELASVQSFNATSKEWKDLSPMTTPRFGCGATRISPSKLVVVGGFDGEIWTKSCELYDYQLNEWTSISPMPESLEFCVATLLGSNHILVSGKPPDGQRFKFYCYNIDQNDWTSFKPAYRFQGKVTALAYGSQVLVVDQYKDTYLTSNILSIVEDDLTDALSQESFDSRVVQSPVPPLSSSISGDDNMPWWASAGVASANLKRAASLRSLSVVEIPRDGEEADSISVFEDSTIALMEDDSVAPSYTSTSSPSSYRRTSRLEKVKDLETSDSFGRKVKFTGYVSTTHKRPHGKGKMTWVDSGNVYAGSFRHGCLDGLGRMRYANGDSFEGMFSKDLRNGRGVFRAKKDGRTFDCDYKNDLPHDPNGSLTWENGTIYVGSFVEGKRNGKGVQRFPNGVRYHGDFVSGKYHGFGTCEFLDGSVYEGEWVKGQANGQGRLTDAKGETMHDGQWENDAPVYEDSEEAMP